MRATFSILGLVAFSVGSGCCSCASASTKCCWQHSSRRVQHSKKTKEEAIQPATRDKLLEDGWSVKVEHPMADFQRLRESVKEAKMMMAEMHSNGSLAVLARGCSCHGTRVQHRKKEKWETEERSMFVVN